MTNEEIIELAGHREVPAWVMKLVGDAVAKEREECAKICEYYEDYAKNDTNYHATLIRARGQE